MESRLEPVADGPECQVVELTLFSGRKVVNATILLQAEQSGSSGNGFAEGSLEQRERGFYVYLIILGLY